MDNKRTGNIPPRLGNGAGVRRENVSDPNLVTMHSLTMTGLTPGTTYYVEITSTNAPVKPSSRRWAIPRRRRRPR